MKPLFLGIDVSTTGAKALLVDDRGTVVKSATTPLTLTRHTDQGAVMGTSRAFTFDAGRRELRRGETGLALPPKVRAPRAPA